MASGDEKFNVSGVKGKMGVIEGYFSDFATTLADINAFVQTNVNASLASAAFGELGGKLLNIWDYNASTFNDFHENFDNWAQVVAIIAANNNQFAVDALATYRDNAGTLDGVKDARAYVSENNGVSNSGSNYAQLSNAARSIIDRSIAQGSRMPDLVNIFGGYTKKEGDQLNYYDKDGNLIVYYKDGKYYDAQGNEIGDETAYRKWLEDHGYVKPGQQQQSQQQTGEDDITLAETNNFGGKTIQKPDGSIEFYDDKGNLIAIRKGDKFFDASGNEIGDYEAYKKWLQDNNYKSDDVIIEQNNNFGGDTVTKPDGSIEYRDADGNVMAIYKDGEFYKPDGTKIGDAEAYRKWLTDNGHTLPKEGTLPGEKPAQSQQEESSEVPTADDVYNMFNDPNASAEDRQKAYEGLSEEDRAIVDGKLAADFTSATVGNAMKWSTNDWSNYDNLPDSAKAKICEQLGYSEISHKDNHYKAVKKDGTYVEEYRDASGTATKTVTYDGSVKTTEDYNNKTTKYEYDEARNVQGRDNVKSYEVKNDAGNETKTFTYEDGTSGSHIKKEVVNPDGSYEKDYFTTRSDGLKKETYSVTDKEMVQTYDSSKNSSGIKTKTTSDNGNVHTEFNSDRRSDGKTEEFTQTNGYRRELYDSDKNPQGKKEYIRGSDKSETTSYDPAKHDNISRVYTSGDKLKTETSYGNGIHRTDIVDPDDSTKITSTVTANGRTYTITNPNGTNGADIRDDVQHGTNVYVAYDKESYVDAITKMRPGDTLIVKVKSLQVDIKGTGSGTSNYKPESGTDSLVLHMEEQNDIDGTVKFTFNGQEKTDHTYTKYDMIWDDAMKDTEWY